MARRLDGAAGGGEPVRPSLANLGIPDTITRALADRGLDAANLTIEITEDMLLDDIERTRIVLQQLRRAGVRVAIDDFGSGYSALSYLRELPIDEVKLDRHFIAPVLGDPRAATVALAVIDLARGLGRPRSPRVSRTPVRRPGCATTVARSGRASS